MHQVGYTEQKLVVNKTLYCRPPVNCVWINVEFYGCSVHYTTFFRLTRIGPSIYAKFPLRYIWYCMWSIIFEGESKALQRRHRFVLRHAKLGGAPCPILTEERPCLSLPLCSTYTWQTSAWTECLFPEASLRCGLGYKIRGKFIYAYRFIVCELYHVITYD